MKAFIVAALLVATVAGQSMNLMDLIKEKSLYKPTHRSMSTVENLLMKEKYGRHMMDWNTKNSMFDMDDSVFGGYSGVSMLSLEELVSHPLFREYMTIPLFRQFWEQYPTVFRHYVESPLFQKFWMVPQFPMYFRNPMFFYKYIVPQVKLISEMVTPYTTEGVYDFGTSTRFNPYTYQPRYNREWSTPMTMSSMMGHSTYDYPTTTTSHYKYLLEKMMNHMNMYKMNTMNMNTMNMNNMMGQDVTETFTDVKMLPNGNIKEQTFGKIVDPITGLEKITVGDVKLVDEKIVPYQSMDFPTVGIEGMTNKYQMNKIFGHHNTENIKDILLKHIILNKIYGDKQVITPEVYRTLFGEHKELYPEMYNMIFKNKNVMTPEILENVFGQNKNVFTPEVFDTLFNTKKTFTPEIFDTVFGENKKVMTPELYEILIKGNKNVISPRVLETIFGKKIYTPEVYGNLFGDKVYDDVYNKYDVNTYEPTFNYNKMNKWNTPLITRMLKNTRTFSPKMDVMTLKEKVMTQKMMEELYKNKEHTSIYNMESEIPTMTEQGKIHIPLTFTKPVVGSGIEEFLREKEIKY